MHLEHVRHCKSLGDFSTEQMPISWNVNPFAGAVTFGLLNTISEIMIHYSFSQNLVCLVCRVSMSVIFLTIWSHSTSCQSSYCFKTPTEHILLSGLFIWPLLPFLTCLIVCHNHCNVQYVIKSLEVCPRAHDGQRNGCGIRWWLLSVFVAKANSLSVPFIRHILPSQIRLAVCLNHCNAQYVIKSLEVCPRTHDGQRNGCGIRCQLQVSVSSMWHVHLAHSSSTFIRPFRPARLAFPDMSLRL